MITPDPFAAIMFLVAAIALLFVIARTRSNMITRSMFNNQSYQLGIVFGAVAWMFVTGFVSALLWIVS